MPLRIRIEHGQDAGKTYRLAAPGVYRIGRSPQGSFQVLDMKVSKDHFELHHDGTTTQVRDLGSSQLLQLIRSTFLLVKRRRGHERGKRLPNAMAAVFK